jgi:hypothetical protein
MLEDGTLVLNLCAEGLHGEIGDAQLTYAPFDPEYGEILRRLGGLVPGESKPVLGSRGKAS